MNKFKIGDSVRYVRSGPIRWESEDWAAADGLILGHVYRVTSSDPDSIRVDGGTHGFDIHQDHFEHFKEEGQATTGWVIPFPPSSGAPVFEYFKNPLTMPPFKDLSTTASSRLTTLPTDSAERKEFPLFRGCFRYFPAALAGVSRISKIGNDKHNPGEPMHHARGKSMDHGDCITRHLMDVADLVSAHEQGKDVTSNQILDEVDQMVWRALAFSQELHERFGAPKAPGAK